MDRRTEVLEYTLCALCGFINVYPTKVIWRLPKLTENQAPMKPLDEWFPVCRECERNPQKKYTLGSRDGNDNKQKKRNP